MEQANPIAGEPAEEAPREDPWAPVVLGDPIFEFEPKPPKSASYQSDTICDAWSCDSFTMRMASVRGYSHRYHGLPRQDDAEVAFSPRSGAVIFAVADGVSSATKAHLGARMACEAGVQAVRRELSSDAGRVDWAAVLDFVVERMFRLAAVTLGQKRPTQQVVLDLMATTLVIGYTVLTETGPVAVLVQIGDSSAWLLRGGQYRSILTEKHDPRQQVISSAVTPLPRLPDTIRPVTLRLPDDGVLLIGTDGFGDPLGDGDGQVGRLFADWLAAPPPATAFAHLLDFSRETFDDDRTLVAIWPRSVNEGPI
ncbi:MAG TPA: protein phosphatase 2C domain-containing protein [Streptosporangiaceae bacterium]